MVKETGELGKVVWLRIPALDENVFDSEGEHIGML